MAWELHVSVKSGYWINAILLYSSLNGHYLQCSLCLYYHWLFTFMYMFTEDFLMLFNSEGNSCWYFYAGNFPRTSFTVDFMLNPLSAIMLSVIGPVLWFEYHRDIWGFCLKYNINHCTITCSILTFFHFMACCYRRYSMKTFRNNQKIITV